jgi:GNAT superfamily N-acetyltransferase
MPWDVPVTQPGRQPMDHARARIRPYRPGDLDALYRICLLTGDAGKDATSLYQDPRLLGHIFAAPYGLFEPSLAFVVEDVAGVGGYIVGALDSQAFEQELDRKWWPELRNRYRDPSPGVPENQWTRDQFMAHVIHHPFRTSDELAERYPSELHINLVPRLQGSGYGRELTSTLIAALRDRGSRGIHLYVMMENLPAVRFYRHLGFTELPATGMYVFGMDLRKTS